MNGQQNGSTNTGNKAGSGLGTFAGVFTPSVLTILGIILFLRLGFVVGSAGLGKALVIIGLANAISVLTSISLSAVATNLRVKGGGDYYLISRTLGVQFGGALGVVLFLAQSVSIAFYCLGFGEVLAGFFAAEPSWQVQGVAAGAVLCLFILAWLGADWATRFQYVVMAVLAAALVSFFTGGLPKIQPSLLAQNWASAGGGPGFWVIFAIFFPAVTGFTQGVSMSGDLKDPGKSLPLGTFYAVGISIVVYFSVALVFASVLPLKELSGDYLAMRKVAWFAPLVDAGVIAATLSSAMASFLGAPRILQSLAGDKVFAWLNPMAKGSGPSNNPRRGVLLSLGIALGTIFVGDLNVIAPVVSMFFLISYGLLNYATYFESRSQSPSFRPRFKWFNKWLSLAGALACLGCMIAIDPWAGLMASAVIMAIYQYLKRSAPPARWSDSQRSYHLQMAREHLLQASAAPRHMRNWRPNILVLWPGEEKAANLTKLASWLEGRAGFSTLLQVVEAQGPRIGSLRNYSREELNKQVHSKDLPAFPLVVAVPDEDEGLMAAVQAFGIGPLEANLVLRMWPGEQNDGLVQSMRGLNRLGLNQAVFMEPAEPWSGLKSAEPNGPDAPRIDVWWNGGPSSRLMLLLAYLMTRSHEWEHAGIRVIAMAKAGEEQQAEEELAAHLEDYRISAKVMVIPETDGNGFAELSKETRLVFVPVHFHEGGLMDLCGQPVSRLEGMPGAVILVLATQDLNLSAEPEEGQVAETSKILDGIERAERRLKYARKALELASAEAAAKLEHSNDPESVLQGDWVERMRDALEAHEHEERARRRHAKAKVMLEKARAEAKELGLADGPDHSGSG